MQRMKELRDLIALLDCEDYWPGFQQTKYALYDEDHYYINDNTGIEGDFEDLGYCFKADVDERFMGNTAIILDDNPVAICNINTFNPKISSEKIASLMVHEMFHCFQSSNDFFSGADEIKGINYQITEQSISLRLLEREALYKAVVVEDMDKARDFVTEFYSIRKERKALFGDNIDYDKGIESIEGTAVYVEYNVWNMLNAFSVPIDEFIEGYHDVRCCLKTRLSLYNQGLLLCLVADRFCPNWKNQVRSGFLSDYIHGIMNIDDSTIIPSLGNDLKEKVGDAVLAYTIETDQLFNDFETNKRSEELYDVTITGFDPMNLVKRGNTILHKSFLRFQHKGEERIVKGPILQTIGESIFDVIKIEW